MKFGNHTVETTIVDDQPTVVLEHYEERHRVKDAKQELASYMQFRDEHPDDHDLSFKIQQSPNGKVNGFYYVVWCWTVKSL